MAAVQQQATLHEKTVQKVAKGEVKTSRKRRVQTLNPNSSISSLRIDKRILSALEGTKVSSDRVQVISENEVIVWNHAAPWPGVTA